MNSKVDISDSNSERSSVEIHQSAQPHALEHKGTYLSQVIDDIGFNRVTALVCAVTGLITFLYGADELFAVLNFKEILSIHGISFTTFSIFLTFLGIALCIGSFISSYLASVLGRIICIRIGVVAYFFIYSSLSLVDNIWVLFVLRFIGGIITTILTNLSKNLLIEYLPSKRRSLIFATVLGLFSFGGLYTTLLNFLYNSRDPTANFKIINLYLRIPLVILIFITFLLENSPYSLFISNKIDEGLKLMRRMARFTKGKIINETKLVDEVKNLSPLQKKGKIWDLFTRQYLKLTIFSLLSFVFNRVVVNSTLLVTVTIDQWSGSVVEIDKELQMVIFLLIVIPGGVISGLFANVRLLGRKGSIILFSMVSIFLLILIIIYHYLYVIEIGFVMLLAHINNAIIILYITEAYPSHLRDSAIGLAYTVGPLVSSLAPYLINILKDPIVNSYYFFLGMVIGCMISSLMLPFDTRKKTLQY